MARFLVDPTANRLVPYLRFCGHDAASAVERGIEADDDLLAVARDEARTLVTRDADLARRADGIRVAQGALDDRLRSLRAAGVDLTLAERPSRCGQCNGSLSPLDPADPAPDYAPSGEAFERWRCRDCGQVFWKGGHWDRVRERLAAL
ncbi:MAG: Mut7-C RNAse domain-containing protein [Haloferacaceae archaeon]